MSYRLLKVIAQAVLVSEDDDGNLVETLAEPVAVTARNWPTYPQQLLAQIAGLTNGKVNTTMTDAPTPDPEPVPVPADPEPAEPGEPEATMDTEGMGAEPDDA